MKYNIYSIQDVMVGFNAPFIMKNDELALRSYKSFLKDNAYSADMRLFRLGTFDEETGAIEGEAVPVLLQGGIENV